jgi:hypothetical protein
LQSLPTAQGLFNIMASHTSRKTEPLSDPQTNISFSVAITIAGTRFSILGATPPECLLVTPTFTVTSTPLLPSTRIAAIANTLATLLAQVQIRSLEQQPPWVRELFSHCQTHPDTPHILSQIVSQIRAEQTASTPFTARGSACNYISYQNCIIQPFPEGCWIAPPNAFAYGVQAGLCIKNSPKLPVEFRPYPDDENSYLALILTLLSRSLVPHMQLLFQRLIALTPS